MRSEALARLAGAIRGSVVGAMDAAYDESRRVWNGAIDKRPELIVNCAGATDVAEAVRYARNHDLESRCVAAGITWPAPR